MTTPLQVGQLLPQPAPEPEARTYAPHSTTITFQASTAHANLRKDLWWEPGRSFAGGCAMVAKSEIWGQAKAVPRLIRLISRGLRNRL